MKAPNLACVMFIFITLLSLNAVAMPQSFTGTVSGRVLDEQGAVIPNAILTLKSAETGVERRANADADGRYEFISVAPGRYSLSAATSGFSPARVKVEVAVATQTRADITIRVSGVSEAVEIIGESGVGPQTEGAELGNVVTQRQVVELPTLTRDPYELIGLSAGAAPSSDGRGVSFAVNGQRSASGNYILDGGENNYTFNAGPTQRVPLDAVKEFRAQTNNYPAEYGRASGFIANVVTKSGTSEYHGSVYLFNRNSALAANTFDNNANNLQKPVFNRNQFGSTIGGPIKKEKLFFFGSFEPIIVRSSGPVTFFVPTPQLVAISSPGTQAIFKKFPLPPDLSTTNVRMRTLCPFGKNCTGGANLVTIPAFAFIARTGPQDAGDGEPQDSLLATGRLDYNIDTKTQIFGRYALDDGDFIAPVRQPYSKDLDRPFTQHSQNVLLNLTRAWSNSLVTESRIVYNRTVRGFPETPTSLFPDFGIFESDVILPDSSTGRGLGASVHFGTGQNLYQIFQTASLIKGKHIFKFGGQGVHLRDKLLVSFLSGGQPVVATFFKAQEFVNGVVSLDINIDPKGRFPGEQLSPPFGPPSSARHFHYNEVSLFIQDTLKVTPRLTFTPGLRWEYFGVFHSPDHEKSLDSNLYYGEGNNVFERIANIRLLRTIDAPGNLKGRFYLPDYKNIAPRLGLAYDIFGDGKTVFRSGVGVFYDRIFGDTLTSVSLNPPSVTYDTFHDVTLTQAILDNPYTALANESIILDDSLLVVHLDQNLKTAYTASWNASIEREIRNFLLASAAYVGASGNRLYSLDTTNREGSGRFLGRKFQCLNPTLCDILTLSNLGHSSYHGLQLKVESNYIERLGFQFGANYTWSHSIDNISSVFSDDLVANSIDSIGFTDEFDPSLDRGDSDFDTRHRLVTNFIWNIPFASKSGRWYAKCLLGGWGISGLLSFQTGQPLSIYDGGFYRRRPRLAGPAPRTTLIPDAVSPNTFLFIPINQTFDNNGFCIPNAMPFACGESVDELLSRNTFRRPGTQYHNLAVMKNFALPSILGREGVRLQLRGEFYNAFNYTNLYVNEETNNVFSDSFNQSRNVAVPGVTVRRGKPFGTSPSFIDSRQIVIAAKFIF